MGRLAMIGAMAVCLAALSACGSDSGPTAADPSAQTNQSEVEQTVQNYFGFLRDNKPDQACEAMTPEYAREVAYREVALNNDSQDCPRAMASIASVIGDDFKPRIAATKVSGNSATVTLDADGGQGSGTLELTQAGSTWKISGERD